MNTVSHRRASQAGYSLIELMLVVGLMSVLGGVAVVQIGTLAPGLKGDGGMRIVLSQMNQAREMAITQRRNMRVSFSTDGTTGVSSVKITREEVPGPALTVLQSVPMEGGVQFSLVSGLPDTPDAFGNSSAVAFGSATEVKFAPDGTLVNQDGVSLNGTVFVAISSQRCRPAR